VKDLQVTCPDGIFRTNSAKSRNNVSGTVHFVPFSEYPGPYRGWKKDQIGPNGGAITCRVGLHYLNTEKHWFFLEVRDPSLLIDLHLREKMGDLIRSGIQVPDPSNSMSTP
jgi:hypothetical protein